MIEIKNIVCIRKQGEKDFVPYVFNLEGNSIRNLITDEVVELDFEFDRVFVNGDDGRSDVSIWTREIWTKHKGVEEKILKALGGEYEVKSLLETLKLVEHTRFYKKLDSETRHKIFDGCIDGVKVSRFGVYRFNMLDSEIKELVQSINKNIDKEEKYQNKYARKQKLKNLFKKKKQIDIDIEEETQEF